LSWSWHSLAKLSRNNDACAHVILARLGHPARDLALWISDQVGDRVCVQHEEGQRTFSQNANSAFAAPIRQLLPLATGGQDGDPLPDIEAARKIRARIS
jgi:hypothetical protein